MEKITFSECFVFKLLIKLRAVSCTDLVLECQFLQDFRTSEYHTSF